MRKILIFSEVHKLLVNFRLYQIISKKLLNYLDAIPKNTKQNLGNWGEKESLCVSVDSNINLVRIQ